MATPSKRESSFDRAALRLFTYKYRTKQIKHRRTISTTPNITATISVEVSDESADLSEVSGNPENMTTGEVDLLGEPVRVTEGVIVRTSDCVDEGVQV